MEQDAALDPGCILTIHAIIQRLPTISIVAIVRVIFVVIGVELAGGGCIILVILAAAHHHGHIRHHILALGVGSVHRCSGSRTVHNDQVGIAFLHRQIITIGGSKALQDLLCIGLPCGGILHLRSGSGRIRVILKLLVEQFLLGLFCFRFAGCTAVHDFG